MRRRNLIGAGAICIALWVYGLVIDRDSTANFIPVGSADNWLHLLLGLGMVVAGVAFGRSVVRTERSLARNQA